VIFQEICAADRRLRINHKAVIQQPWVRPDVMALLEGYLSAYAAYHGLSAKEVAHIYEAFVVRYAVDVEEFLRTGSYPAALGKSATFGRREYDIALILSPLTGVPRCRIVHNIAEAAMGVDGRVAVVGAGSGLELELLRRYAGAATVESFDLDVSDFVRHQFRDFEVREREFKADGEKFEWIFAVELLEHLSDPFAFLATCCAGLVRGGTLYATTATNMPQCDHLYNFLDDELFAERVEQIGFRIAHQSAIEHAANFQQLNAKNTWYALEKTR
jgi:hypothetical protein